MAFSIIINILGLAVSSWREPEAFLKTRLIITPEFSGLHFRDIDESRVCCGKGFDALAEPSDIDSFRSNHVIV